MLGLLVLDSLSNFLILKAWNSPADEWSSDESYVSKAKFARQPSCLYTSMVASENQRANLRTDGMVTLSCCFVVNK